MGEAVEGIRGDPYNPVDTTVDSSNPYGKRNLSLTTVETTDLLGEGPMDGLVSTEYVLYGTLGRIGWDSVQLNTFPSSQYSQSLTIPVDDSFLRSVYLNETPVLGQDGLLNFQKTDIRIALGTANGDAGTSFWPFTNLAGANSNQITRPIGERLYATPLDTNGTPIVLSDRTKVYRINNADCSGVKINLRIPTLLLQIVSGNNAGDIAETDVSLYIQWRPIYSNYPVQNWLDPLDYIPGQNRIPSNRIKIKGKITNNIIFPYTIRFDDTIAGTSNPKWGPWRATDGNITAFEVRVVRTTPESTTSFLKNATFIDSLTEIYNDSYSYPFSVIVRTRFRADFFAQIPSRAFDLRLLKVKIPSNYDPILKNYNGSWDGTFADIKAWTDNPAWCFYDLLTNGRYGLGRYIQDAPIDKWTLYAIAQYCDTLVSNGEGNLEPRFTCNLLLGTREEAYKIINDFASIFRAMVYYGQGTIFAIQDSEKVTSTLRELTVFTNSNVENGDFNYSSSSKRVRDTVAIVRYNDPKNFYKPTIEYVEDVRGIRKYGIRETQISAFGCTSRGQAIRLGRWALLTELYETETINFVAGLEGAYLRPGDVFKVYDANRKEKNYAGRTRQVINTPSTVITLDRLITGLNPALSYKFSLVTPTYVLDPSQNNISSTDDLNKIRKSSIQTLHFSAADMTDDANYTTITFPTPRSSNILDEQNYSLIDNMVWSISLVTETSNYDDILAFPTTDYDFYRVIKIEEKDAAHYNIIGLQYSAQKFLEIESGLSFGQSDVIVTVPTPPQGLMVTVDTN